MLAYVTYRSNFVGETVKLTKEDYEFEEGSETEKYEHAMHPKYDTQIMNENSLKYIYVQGMLIDVRNTIHNDCFLSQKTGDLDDWKQKRKPLVGSENPPKSKQTGKIKKKSKCFFS